MITIVTAALSSILGGVVVVILQYFLAGKSKHGEELRELRYQAYSDFIKAASKIIASRRIGQVDDELEDLALLNDAKARICILGEAAVVKELAEFWEHGATLERETEILAFTRFCMRIRESIGNKNDNLYSINISQLLFKLEPANFSFKKDRGTS